jgi:transcriptional antiterminator Rof (Rho-off)
MESSQSDYEPIACRLYDELGLCMLRGTPCTLILDNDGSETIHAVIRDIFTEGDAEYALLDKGRRIRLDLIQGVDDVAPTSD